MSFNMFDKYVGDNVREPATPEQVEMFKFWEETQLKKGAEALDTVVNKMRMTLDVNVFRESYLAYFIRYFTTGDVNQDYWISNVSQTPFAEVDLIDKDGNVVATVPPLIVNNDLITDLPISPENLAFQIEQRSKSAPGISDAMVQEVLINNSNLNSEGELKAADDKWRKLFEYFSVITPDKNSNSSNTNQPISSSIESLGYEDF